MVIDRRIISQRRLSAEIVIPFTVGYDPQRSRAIRKTPQVKRKAISLLLRWDALQAGRGEQRGSPELPAAHTDTEEPRGRW